MKALVMFLSAHSAGVHFVNPSFVTSLRVPEQGGGYAQNMTYISIHGEKYELSVKGSITEVAQKLGFSKVT